MKVICAASRIPLSVPSLGIRLPTLRKLLRKARSRGLLTGLPFVHAGVQSVVRHT